MFDALYIGAIGMHGQQMQLDAVAHNIANLNTVGFRRSSVSFAEIAATIASASSSQDVLTTTLGQSAGAGSRPELTMSTLAGELKQTGEPLDIAIDGPGYIEVMRADGTSAYTRAGHLRVDAEGLLSAAEGSTLAARIEVPTDARNLRVAEDGRVTATIGDQVESTELGRIELTGFANPSGLQSLGDNMYAATTQSGEPQTAVTGETGFGILRQGFVESSNVQMTDELVTLMLAQRSFEMNSKVLQAADQLLSITNGLYR